MMTSDRKQKILLPDLALPSVRFQDDSITLDPYITAIAAICLSQSLAPSGRMSRQTRTKLPLSYIFPFPPPKLRQKCEAPDDLP